jgi:hypothetical protein
MDNTVGLILQYFMMIVPLASIVLGASYMMWRGSFQKSALPWIVAGIASLIVFGGLYLPLLFTKPVYSKNIILDMIDLFHWFFRVAFTSLAATCLGVITFFIAWLLTRIAITLRDRYV